MVNCPFCNSPRIISARHDSDWNGGSRISTVNADDVYSDGDLDKYGDVVNFGDIDILVCLGCDYTWQRYGSFRPTSRALDGACTSCKLELTPRCPIRTGNGCDLYQPRQ